MSGQHRTGRDVLAGIDRRRAIVVVVAALLIVAALLAILLSGPSKPTAGPPTPPSPSVSIGTSRPSPPSTAKKPLEPIKCSRPAASGSSAPTRVCVPKLRVDATVMRLGLNKDRTVEVPPLSRVGDAGWYKYSAPPGSVGPTVILGHVDSAKYGEGVFYRLGTLRTGDEIVLTRGDGKVAIFRVTQVSEVSKKRFPSDAVYGSTSGPAVRLVTCGGKFNSATGNYEDNIIAYGTLASLR